MSLFVTAPAKDRLNWDDVVSNSIPIIRSFIDSGVVPTVRAVYYALL